MKWLRKLWALLNGRITIAPKPEPEPEPEETIAPVSPDKPYTPGEWSIEGFRRSLIT